MKCIAHGMAALMALCVLMPASSAEAQSAEPDRITGTDSSFQRGLVEAFKGTGLLDGLDIDGLDRRGRRRMLEIDEGELLFFRLNDDGEDDEDVDGDENNDASAEAPSTVGNVDTVAGGAGSESASGDGSPAAAPVGQVDEQPIDAPGAGERSDETAASAESSEDAADAVSVLAPEPLEGRFYVSYETEKLKLSRFYGGQAKDTGVDFELRDVVFLFSNKEHKERLSKLALHSKTSRYLQQFLDDRRNIELLEGGMLYAKLVVKDVPFFDGLDGGLDFKETELLVKGHIGGRMLRRVLGLDVKAQSPDIGPDDLNLNMKVEGFRPRRIGRYVDAHEVTFNLKSDETGTVRLTGKAALARFGIGARKIKVPGNITVDPDAKDAPVFIMRASAGESDLRRVRVGKRDVKELDFEFSLNSDFEPKLRAEGHAGEDDDRVPISAELDEEDGQDLFRLDGSTLEALSGLDIPGLDEITFTDPPKPVAGQAMTLETTVRGKAATVIIGPHQNEEASYVAVAFDGGLGDLLPARSLGEIAEIETARSMFLYLPKGRAPPRLTALPNTFRDAFETSFSAADFGDAGQGLTIFQQSRFASNHSFSRAIRMFRGRNDDGGAVQIIGQINPLIFDEPEDGISETWSGDRSRDHLKRIVDSALIEGRVAGLEGMNVGTMFRLADTAVFEFKAKSLALAATLKFGGRLTLRGTDGPRRFEFLVDRRTSGEFTWQGVEVDADGVDVPRGQRVTVAGRITGGGRPEDLNVFLPNAYPLRAVFDAGTGAVGDIEIGDVALGRGYIQGVFTNGRSRSWVTIADTPDTRFAVVAIDPAARPASYLPGLKGTVLEDMALPNSIVMIADESADRATLEALPGKMDEMLLGALEKADLDISPGFTFLSRLAFKGNDPLSQMAQRLGVPETYETILSGKIPATVLTAIAGGRAPKTSDVGDLTLKAKWPKLMLRGTGAVFRLDETAELGIRLDDDGKLRAFAETGGRITVPVAKRDEDIRVLAGIVGEGRNREVSVYASSPDLDGRGMPRLALSAWAPLEKNAFDKAGGFVASAEAGMSLSDLLGRDVLGIGALQVRDAKLSPDNVVGVLDIGDAQVRAHIAVLGGGRKILVMEAPAAPGAALIPGLHGTVLNTVMVEQSLIAYLTPSGGGTQSEPVAVSELSEGIRNLVDALQLPSADGAPALSSGVNLLAGIGSEELGLIRPLLMAGQGRSPKGFRLTASMPANALAFIGDALSRLTSKSAKRNEHASVAANNRRTALPRIETPPANLLPGVIAGVAAEIPVANVVLPGVSDYLVAGDARIRVFGANQSASDAQGLRTELAGVFDLALPGTPMRGTITSAIKLHDGAGAGARADFTGDGRLRNQDATVTLAGSYDFKSKSSDVRVEIAGPTLDLAGLTGLRLSGVTDLPLSGVSLRDGQLVATLSVNNTPMTATAFGFARDKKAFLALASNASAAATFVPGMDRSIFAGATLDQARLLLLPKDGQARFAKADTPDGIADTFARDTLTEGLNGAFRFSRSPGSSLSEVLTALGIGTDGTLTLRGVLPDDAFGISDVDGATGFSLTAALPKPTFSRIGDVKLGFTDTPVLTIEKQDNTFAEVINTGLWIELPGRSKRYIGTATFRTGNDQGGRELQFLATAVDPDGRKATVEAEMNLPGSPADFRIDFAGEQSLSSLLGVDIPFIGDKNVNDLEKDDDVIAGKLELKGHVTPVGAFRIGGRWVVIVSSAGAAPKDFLPGFADMGIERLSLTQSTVVFVPPEPGEADGTRIVLRPSEIPARVRVALGDVLSPLGSESVAMRSGLNLFAQLDVTRSPNLKRMLSYTRSRIDRPIVLSGLLPTQSLKALAVKGSAFRGEDEALVRKLVAGVDLSADISDITLPGVDRVVTFARPRFHIAPLDEAGEQPLAAAIRGRMTVALPGAPIRELAGKISLASGTEGSLLNVVGTGVTHDEEEERDLRVAGSVPLRGNTPNLRLAYTTDARVKDLVGGALPGLGGRPVAENKFDNGIISGAVQYKDARMPIAAFDFSPTEEPFVAAVIEQLDVSALIPALKSSPLADQEISESGLVFVPKGKDAFPDMSAYPAYLQDIVQTVTSNNTRPVREGVMAGLNFGVSEGSQLAKLFGMIGVDGTKMTLVGTLPKIVINQYDKQRRELTQMRFRNAKPVKTSTKGWLASEVVRRIDLEARLPGFTVPGINRVLSFGESSFYVKGADVKDTRGNLTGVLKLKTGIHGDMSLRLPDHTIGFDCNLSIEKESAGKSLSVRLDGNSKIKWNKAFGIPFLELSELGMAGTLSRSRSGDVELIGKLSSKIAIDKVDFASSAAIRVANKKLAEVRFSIDNKIRVADLPGVKAIPGVNEVSFENLWIGSGGLGGRVAIDKLGIGGDGALFIQGGKPVLLVRADQLDLGNLLGNSGPIGGSLKQMWDPLMGIKFPSALFVMSTAELKDRKLRDLPIGVRPLLKDLVSELGRSLPINKGISLMVALNEKDLPASVRQTVTRDMNVFDAIDGPLILAGSLNGLFNGQLDARLAVNLPNFKFPQNQPWQKIVSVDSVGAEGFLFVDVPRTQLGLGVKGNITLDVPQVGNDSASDELRFNGQLYTSFDAVSWAGSFKVAGNMKGTWNSPFGINGNMSIRDPSLLLGVDSEGSLEFGIGGDSIVRGLAGGKTLTTYADLMVNLNFSTTIPIPKKLAIGYKIDGEVDLLTTVKLQEAMLKGLLTGPMAGKFVDLLPDSRSREAGRFLQSQLRSRSLMDLLQLEKLPLPWLSLKNPYVFLATPGAKLPGRDETLDTIGARLSGELNADLLGKRYRLAGTDMRLTLSDGLILKGDIADVNLSPGGSTIFAMKNAKMDIVANLKQLPHFMLSGDFNLLGAKERLDMEISKDRIAFHYDKDLGPVIKIKVDGRTEGGEGVKAKEFRVDATTKTEIDELLTNEIFPRMGIPPVIADILKKQTPLFVHGATFSGALKAFAKGDEPLRLEIDHSFFGTRMKEPAVAELVPIWTSQDPTKVFPVESIAAALTRSFFAYVKENPIELGRVNLGLVSIEEASLRASSAATDKFTLHGRMNALGLPFSESTASFNNQGRMEISSTTAVHLPLPMGSLGTLGKSRTTLDYVLDGAGLKHDATLTVSTAALGFEDSIVFKLKGDLNATTVSFRSDNPCARFSSENSLSAGELRNFAFKIGKGTATPIDFVKTIGFNPKISFPGPVDALECGKRIIGVVGNIANVVNQGLQKVDEASKEVIKFAGKIANEIFNGLKKLAGCLSKHGCAHNFKYGEVLLRDFRDRYATKNMCADIRGQSTKPDTDLIIYPCHMRWNQAFVLRDDGRIASIKSDRCLGTRAYRNNGQVALMKCHWNDVLLKFEFLATGQVKARRWQGNSGDLCLATKGGNLVVQYCPDARDSGGDKWAAYEPRRGGFVDKAGERDRAMQRAAFGAPMSNGKAVPFYRFEDSRTLEQRHTWNGLNYARSSQWNLDDRIGLIYPKRHSGTVPLFIYERRVDRKVQQAFTTDPKQFSGGAHGLILDGVAGYLYPNNVPGSLPLYLHEHRSKGDFVLSEKSSISGFGSQGVVGYAIAPPPPPGDDEPYETSNPERLADTGMLVFPKRAEDTVALYRYKSPQNGDELFTTDFGELGAGSPFYNYEDIAGWVFAGERAGTTPIYRYNNKGNGRHALTVDAKKYNGTRGAGGYAFEKIEGYAVTDGYGPGKDSPVATAAVQPLLRYFNPTTSDHMYTADPNQLGDGDDGYVRDGHAGGIFTARAKGTVPLYRYWNERTKDHIFTSRFQDLWFGKDGYDYIGIEGYVYPGERPGTMALHRYANGATRDNLLTTDFDEYNGRRGRDGFVYVRTEGYVPRSPTPADDVRETSVEAVDLLRYRHPSTGRHRIVSHTRAPEAVRDGFRLDRPVGQIHPERAKGSVAVYEYVSGETGARYVTSDYSTLGPGKFGMQYRRIAGWVFPNKGSGHAALYSYQNPSSGDQVVTGNFDAYNGERGKDGYEYQGIVGWVAPFHAPGTDAPIERSDPVLLSRYYNSTTEDHRMTAGESELGNGALGYELEGYHGYIWPKRAKDTVPVYRYFNEERNDTLITHEYDEYWQGRDGYRYQGILGYVYPSERKDAVAIHRYFGRSQLDSLVTTSFGELDGKKGRFSYEYARITGWVPGFVPPGMDARIEKSDARPLIRYVNNKTGGHEMATGSDTYGTQQGPLRIERVQGRIFPKRAEGTVPLYRYVSRKARGSRFTTDFSELLFNKGGFKFDGVIGYVYPDERSGTVALRRYDNDATGDTILTVYADEMNGDGGRDEYKFVGIAGWVPDYPDRPAPGFENFYLATNDNFSCLDSDDRADTILTSRLCQPHEDLRFALWQDGTLRHNASALCLGPASGSPDQSAISTVTCDYSEAQQWEMRWQGGKRPSAPDGTTRLQLVHKQSGKCLGLENASAQDGVEADLYPCKKANDNVQTWVINAETPEYVLPGTEAPVNTAEPEWLVRYHNPKRNGGDSLAVVGFDDFGRGRDGYVPERLMGRLHVTKNAADMVPLYRYSNDEAGDHLFTTDFDTYRFALDGYAFERVVGYVYPDVRDNAVALHRYANPSRKDTLLTTDFVAWGGNAGRNGYRYEGVQGWTPDTAAVATAPWDGVYVANAGGMVCLDATDDARLSSSRCVDDPALRAAFYSDGTVRFGDDGKCLEAPADANAEAYTAACDGNLLQRWDLAWQGGNAASRADGGKALQLRHWRTEKCLVLENGSGVDGVAARLGGCANFTKTDRKGTWFVHADMPVFVPPGSDAPIAAKDPVPLIRYVKTKSKSGDHRLAAGPSELGLGRDGYEIETAQGYIYEQRAAETVPLYQYANGKSGDHISPTDFRVLGWGAYGYEYLGVAGYVFPRPAKDAVALRNYAHDTKGDNLLTSSADEFGGDKGRHGYAFTGIVGHVPRYPEDPEPGFEGIYLSTGKNLSCLDADKNDGAPLQSSFCHDHAVPQFTFWQDGTIRHDPSGQCLTVRDAGGPVTLARCAYTRAQQFVVRWQGSKPKSAAAKPSLQIAHADSGRCLGLANASGQDGVAAVMQACKPAGENVQTFTADTSRPVFVAPGVDAPLVNADPVPFIRYVGTSKPNDDHLMQAGPEPMGLGRDGYDMELAQGLIFEARTTDTVPFYRYVDGDKGDTIYTSDFHEFRYAKGTTAYDGIVGYVYGEKRNGAVPLHRYANANKGDHLLAQHLDEFNGKAGKGGYKYDGIVAWLPPYDERPAAGLSGMYLPTNGNLSCLDGRDETGATVASRFCETEGELTFTSWTDGTFRHDAGGLCLTLRGRVRQGDPVKLERCSYTADQQWALNWQRSAPSRAAGGQTLKFKHVGSGLCIGLRGGSGQDGVEAAAFRCDKDDPDLQAFAATLNPPKFVPPGMETKIVNAEPVPFVRYAKRSGSARDHRMMAHYHTLDTGKDGYGIEHPQGMIYERRTQRAQPFYRYRHEDTGNHLYARDFHEFRYARDGYAYDGYVGFVLAEEARDTVKLHRYLNDSTHDQILTTDFNEMGRANGQNGYVYQGIAAWVPLYAAEPVQPLDGMFVTTGDWLCLSPVTGGRESYVELQPCQERDGWRLTHYDDDTLRIGGADLCLSTTDGRVSGGLRTCAYRNPDQVFDVRWTGNRRVPKGSKDAKPFQIVNQTSGRCLGYVGRTPKPGSRLQDQRCAGRKGNANQNWMAAPSFPDAKPIQGWQGLTLAGSNALCMDAGSGGHNGAKLRTTACDSRANIAYSLFADGTIRHDATGRCVTFPENGGSGSAFALSPCRIRHPAQSFELLWNGKGKAPNAADARRSVRIRNVATGKCLHPYRDEWNDSRTITITRCAGPNGQPGQNWRLRPILTQ